MTSIDLDTHHSSDPTDTTATLLVAPVFSDHEDTACTDLLTITDSSQLNVLLITFTQSPTERLRLWQSNIGDKLPPNLSIISIGNQTSSSDHVGNPMQPLQSVSVQTVPNPGDLTKLGIEITSQLEDWSKNDRQTVVCFHSLTPLLQYADLERVFKFLHTMINRFRRANIIAHFHLATNTHTDQTENTLKQLFDAVIEIDDTNE